MFTTLLGSKGWDVRFLGVSAPPEDIAAYAADLAPVCVVTSCTVPTYLPGAARTIAAVHAIGPPVLAGGRAFGNGPSRALAVGADGWAPEVGAADGLVRYWAAGGVERLPAAGWQPVGAAAHRALASRHDDLVAEAFTALWSHLPVQVLAPSIAALEGALAGHPVAQRCLRAAAAPAGLAS